MSNVDLFGFFPVTESSTLQAATIACELAHEFSRVASSYGDGVKSITATLILTDPTGLGVSHKDQQPEFHRGLRRIEALGTVIELEDELEFTIRPSFSTINGVSDRAIVANAIASALLDVHSQLATMDIPCFDMSSFLSDIETFFTKFGHVHENEKLNQQWPNSSYGNDPRKTVR